MQMPSTGLSPVSHLNAQTKNNKKGQHTGCLPLLFVHRTLAILINDLHGLEQPGILGFFCFLFVNTMEFFFVYGI